MVTSAIIQNRLEEVERRVQGLRSVSDLEVSTETIPWMLSRLGDGGTLFYLETQGFHLKHALPFEDLGFALSPQAKSHLGGTTIKSIPPEYTGGFTTAQATARRAGWYNSYDLSIIRGFFHGWFYIPWSAWEAVETAVAHAAEQLHEAKGKLETNHRVARAQIENVLEEIASRAVAQLVADMPGHARHADEIHARIVTHGLRRFDEIMERLPTIGFRVKAKAIVLGSEFYAAQIEEQRLNGQMSAEARENWARQEQANLQVREAERLSQMRVQAEARQIQADADVRERVRRAQLDTARSTVAEIVNPFREGMDILRARMNRDLTEIRDALQTKGALAPATAARLSSLAEDFRKLNFTNDQELQTLIDDVAMMASVGGRGSAHITAPVILDQLNDVVSLTAASARVLARSAREDFVVL